MDDPQSHVDAIAENETNGSEPRGENVGGPEESYGLVDHDQVVLVDGSAISRGIGVALGDPIDAQ